MSDLVINKIYLIQQGYFPVFNEDYYNSVVPMGHTHTTTRMDDGTRFYFWCPADGTTDSFDGWSIATNVFEDDEAFLKFSVDEALRINTPMDDYFKELINVSRDKYPEKWV